MSTVLRFGEFELHPARGQLLLRGAPVAIGQRAFDLLELLARRAGELVGKDDLIAHAWPGLVVEENNLQVQISALRKALGAGAIATVAGRGYRLTLAAHTPHDPAPLARRHNLPRPLTSFVGHAEDLAEYADLVTHSRLLTLTGIGGCGKSRLVIELADRVRGAFPDGVWYVDLAPLQDAERLALTVATVLGVREDGGRSLADALAAHLARQRALLVLDNCEHLATACAAFVRFAVDAAPDVHVLAASREGLCLPGERAVTVRSLTFAAPGAKGDFATLAALESVQLFADRARLADPAFALTPENVEAVAEICRRLDGIPLALELAAARVRLLGVHEIRARLDDRFRLLTGSGRTAVARQQTLLATIQWSYDHLCEDERRLLRQLSVFAGGWTLAAATTVTAPPADEYAVLDLIERLADQSLVTAHHMHAGVTRYTMLETVRQYAQERMHDEGEEQAARRRHLELFVNLAETADPALVGPDQTAWLARLDPELENFLVAHAHCDDATDGALLGLRLAHALRMYLRQRGLTGQGYRMALEALARPGAQGRTLTRCRALWAAGEHAYFMGRYREGREHVTEALVLAREHDDGVMIAQTLRNGAYLTLALGDAADARARFEEALAVSRTLGDPFHICCSLNGLAELLRATGEPAAAVPLYEEALRLSHDRGDLGGNAVHLSNLAWAMIALDRAQEAREFVTRGMAIVGAIGAERIGFALLDCATGLAAMFGDEARAARLCGSALAIFDEAGYRREPADERSLAPWVARIRERLGEAAFADAVAAGRALSFPDAIAETFAWLAGLRDATSPPTRQAPRLGKRSRVAEDA